MSGGLPSKHFQEMEKKVIKLITPHRAENFKALVPESAVDEASGAFIEEEPKQRRIGYSDISG